MVFYARSSKVKGGTVIQECSGHVSIEMNARTRALLLRTVFLLVAFKSRCGF